jgi:hypothetical protein
MEEQSKRATSLLGMSYPKQLVVIPKWKKEHGEKSFAMSEVQEKIDVIL